jgi:hypothetical protein
VFNCHTLRRTNRHALVAARAQGLVYDHCPTVQPSPGHLNPWQFVAVLYAVEGNDLEALLGANLHTLVAEGAALGLDEDIEVTLVATLDLQPGLLLGIAQLYLTVQVQPLIQG